MSKYDIYLYENSTVLKNKLNITDEAALDKAEADLAKANMILLYDSGFSDFSPSGVCKIHQALFGDIYEWAGQYRTINIQKREPLLAGKSVWYSNWDDIDRDLSEVWQNIDAVDWNGLSQEDFVKNVTRFFSAIWQVHPFREGNTRTTVMMIALFVEHNGYYFDYDLMEASAGYVRNSLVLCCFGEHSEYEHLERILMDAICTEPIEDSDDDADESTPDDRLAKYEKYHTKDYKPSPHEYVEEED